MIWQKNTHIKKRRQKQVEDKLLQVIKYLREYGLEFIDYKPDVSPYFKTSFS